MKLPNDRVALHEQAHPVGVPFERAFGQPVRCTDEIPFVRPSVRPFVQRLSFLCMLFKQPLLGASALDVPVPDRH